MADNEQTFGLNAQDAISELQRLDSALAGVNRSISALRRVTAGNIDTPFNQATKNAKRYSSAAKNAASSTEDITLSWKTLGRVVQTQLIVRGINEVSRLFSEAAAAAEQFQITVAQIDAIDTSALGMDELGEEIEQISVEIGRPLQEVADATFEALQNDISTTQGTFRLLREDINDIALLTGSELPTAVNVASASIRSFNLTAEEQSRISALLFQTINTGIITMDELEGAIGTVGALASRNNVQFAEFLGLLSSITRQGVSTNKALTQLRNLFNKGLAPTEALQNELEKLGTDSFPQLVEQSGGVLQALRALEESVGGNSEKLASLFGTVRARLAVFNLLANEGKDTEQTLREIAEAGDEVQAALEQIRGTDAFQARQNAQEFGRILKDLGDDALVVKNTLSDVFLTIIPDAEAAEVAISGAAAAAGLFGLRMLGLKAAVTGAPGILTTLGLTASVLAGIEISDNINRWRESVVDSTTALEGLTQAGQDAVIEAIDETQVNAVKDYADELENADNNLNNLVANNEAAVKRIVNEAADANRIIGQTANNAVERFAEGRAALLERVKDAINDLDETAREAQRGVQEANQSLEDFNLEREIARSTDLEAAQLRSADAAEKLAEAREAAANVGLAEASREEAFALQDAAEAAAQANLRAAERLGSQRETLRAEQTYRAVLKNRAAINERVAKVSQNSASQYRKKLLVLSNLNQDQIKELKEINELFQIDGPDDARKTVEELRNDVKEGKERWDEFRKSFGEFADAGVLSEFGLTEVAKRLNEELTTEIDGVTVKWDAAIAQLDEQLKDQVFVANIRFEREAREIAAGDQRLEDIFNQAQLGAGGDPTEFTRLLQEGINDQLEQQKEFQLEITGTNQKLDIFRKSIKNAADTASGFNLADHLVEELGDDLDDRLAGQLRGALKILETGTPAELARLRTILVQSAEELGQGFEEGLIRQADFEVLNKALKNTFGAIDARIKQIQAESNFDPEFVERLREISEAGPDIGLSEEARNAREAAKEAADETKRVKDGAKEAAGETGNLSNNMNSAEGSARSLASTTGGVAGAADQTTRSFIRLRDAASAALQAASAAVNISPGGGQTNPLVAHNGGQVKYRAAGGSFVRGQDRQVGVFDPSEFIVNARSSRNFFSELQAINSGRAPSSVSNNETTNITIGDINVNSQSRLPSGTARDIGKSINREIRRGTIRR